MERIELCSNKCCPTLSYEEDGKETRWTITDDFEGKVILTDEQLGHLINIVNKHKASKNGLYIQS